MGVQAKVISDSLSVEGVRLTTIELTYWLMVHNELLTHRRLWKTDNEHFETWLDASRNSSSNRALPPGRIRKQVVEDPYIPVFRVPTRGMVSDRCTDEVTTDQARTAWLTARDSMVFAFDLYDNSPVHKQHRNRLLAPWQYITTVCTANQEWWEHFFALRDHADAQPDIAVVAELAHDAYSVSRPSIVDRGDWHLPYIVQEDLSWNFGLTRIVSKADVLEVAKKVSVARCARSSYLRQGEQLAVMDDLALYERLTTSVPPHASPLEHVATPIGANERSGNFVGWQQLRHSTGSKR